MHASLTADIAIAIFPVGGRCAVPPVVPLRTSHQSLLKYDMQRLACTPQQDESQALSNFSLSTKGTSILLPFPSVKATLSQLPTSHSRSCQHHGSRGKQGVDRFVREGLSYQLNTSHHSANFTSLKAITNITCT